MILQEFSSPVPIIRLFHRSTRMHCNISFADGLMVENSRLLKYLYGLQPEAIKLAHVIVVWADHFVADFISKDVLNALIIFFLQTWGFLPSMRQIQKLNRGTQHIVGGWFFHKENYYGHYKIFLLAGLNVAFNDNLLLSSYELPLMPNYKQFISEFFSYYHTFDFYKKVVSTYYGKPMPKKRFPQFSNNIMVVVGPFKFTQNLTSDFNLSRLVTFCKFCKKCIF